jgi:hypothetical protein
LKAGGLSDWERVQQVSRHVASLLYEAEAVVCFLSGVLHLIPQAGSPFAMIEQGRHLVAPLEPVRLFGE